MMISLYLIGLLYHSQTWFFPRVWPWPDQSILEIFLQNRINLSLNRKTQNPKQNRPEIDPKTKHLMSTRAKEKVKVSSIHNEKMDR